MTSALVAQNLKLIAASSLGKIKDARTRSLIARVFEPLLSDLMKMETNNAKTINDKVIGVLDSYFNSIIVDQYLVGMGDYLSQYDLETKDPSWDLITREAAYHEVLETFSAHLFADAKKRKTPDHPYIFHTLEQEHYEKFSLPSKEKVRIFLTPEESHVYLLSAEGLAGILYTFAHFQASNKVLIAEEYYKGEEINARDYAEEVDQDHRVSPTDPILIYTAKVGEYRVTYDTSDFPDGVASACLWLGKLLSETLTMTVNHTEEGKDLRVRVFVRVPGEKKADSEPTLPEDHKPEEPPMVGEEKPASPITAIVE